jgi:hypothetical protein
VEAGFTSGRNREANAVGTRPVKIREAGRDWEEAEQFQNVLNVTPAHLQGLSSPNTLVSRMSSQFTHYYPLGTLCVFMSKWLPED